MSDRLAVKAQIETAYKTLYQSSQPTPPPEEEGIQDGEPLFNKIEAQPTFGDNVSGIVAGLFGAPQPTALRGAAPPRVIIPPRLRSAIIPSWIARVRCNPFEVNCSFSVFLFIGDVPEEPDNWTADPAFAGINSVFVNSNPDQCANCTRNAEMELNTEGFVKLNSAINRILDSKTLIDPQEVVRHLGSKLQWRVKSVGDLRFFHHD